MKVICHGIDLVDSFDHPGLPGYKTIKMPLEKRLNLLKRILTTLQQNLGEQALALTMPQVRMLLDAVLPRPAFDVDAALKDLRRIQLANHRSYLSHRRRTLPRLVAT